MAPKGDKKDGGKDMMKIAVVGPPIGKTRLIMRWLHDNYEEDYDPTLEDHHSGELTVGGENQKIELLDTSGDDTYQSQYEKWFSWADGFVLTYSVNDYYSFDAVQGFRRAVLDIKQDPETPFLLVATQADGDEKNKRKITTKEGRSIAYKWNTPYIECSAKVGLNAKEAFEACAAEIKEFSKKTAAREERMHTRPATVTMEGKLSKKEKGMMGSKYQKRFVALADNYMFVFKGDKDLANWKNVAQAIPLFFAKVNVISDSHAFEVVVGANEHQFQGENDADRDKWMTAIKAFSREYADEANKQELGAALAIVRENKSNLKCADCQAADPDWASLKFGVVLCLQCSTIHKNLKSGSVSQVRSLTLDEWDSESVHLLRDLGNETANSVLEASFLPMMPRPQPTDDRDKKLEFIRQKYVQKKFLPPRNQVVAPAGSDPNGLLFAAAATGDMKKAFALLCHGAETSWKNPDLLGQTCMHQAVISGKVSMLELLLTNSAIEVANINDDAGHSPIHYATEFDKPECAVLLIKRGAALPDDIDLGAAEEGAQEPQGDVKVEEAAQAGPAHSTDKVMRVALPWLNIIRNVRVNPNMTVQEILDLITDKAELTEDEHSELQLIKKDGKKKIPPTDKMYTSLVDKDTVQDNYEVPEPKGYRKRIKAKEKLEIKRAKQEEEKKEDKGLWKREKESSSNVVKTEKVVLAKKQKKKKGKEEAAAAPAPKLYYGARMTDIAERDKVKVPRVVTEIIEHMKAQKCEEESGIFRLVGDKLDVEAIKAEYNNNATVDLAKYADINVHASSLKLFFRELVEPMIPYALYDPLLAAHKSGAPPGCPATNDALKAVLDQLPPPNRATLAYLIRFLTTISVKSSTNMMTSSNLGICFGPSIMQPDPATASITAQLTDIAFQTGIIRQLIDNAAFFFPPEADVEAAPVEESAPAAEPRA